MKTMADTKTRLLEATLNLISERGYFGATTKDIAQEAGVTEITLFRHFGSKEHLFEEMLKAYSFQSELEGLQTALEGLSHEEALYLIGEKYLARLKKKRSLVRIMLSEMNLYPEKIRVVYNNISDEVIRTLTGYLSALWKEDSSPLTPELSSRAFLGMIFSFFQREELIKGRDVSSREAKAAIQRFVHIFLYGAFHA
jgi:AcrR family transcriptional regulator